MPSSTFPCQRKRIFRFAVFVGGSAAFMSTWASKPIWDLLPLLYRIQFPWRFLGITELGTLTVLSLYFAGKGTSFANASVRNRLFQTSILVSLLLVVWATAFPHTNIDRSLNTPLRTAISIGLEPREYQTSYTADEYSYSGLRNDLPYYPQLEQLRSSFGGKFAIVRSGDAQFEVTNWDPPRSILIKVSRSSGSILALAQFYFPTWDGELIDNNGKVSQLDIFSGHAGLMNIKIPVRNNVSVRIRSNSLFWELIGSFISGFSLILWLAIVLRKYVSCWVTRESDESRASP
jgi:hypothetical protein